MAFSNRAYMEIQDAAWRACAEELGYPSSDDQSRRKLLSEDKRLASLTLLKIFAELSEALEVSSYNSETDALSAGATYVEIATARGVSRQAVRQRRKRQLQSLKQQKRRVLLLGGPYSGDEINVTKAAKAVQASVSVYPRYDEDDRGPADWTARYEQSTEDEGQFVFMKIEEVTRPG
jgi:hypothetical protein